MSRALRNTCSISAAATATDADDHRHNPNSNMWKAMRDFALVMNKLKAPAFIHGGTLLGLVRYCTTFGDDVDFALPAKWYQHNYDKISAELKKSGFRFKWYFPGAKRSFPKPSIRKIEGFETSWIKYNIKVDLFGAVVKNDQYITGLWTPSTKFNKCYTNFNGNFKPFTWHGVPVKVPVPFDTVLKSLYGAKYMKKVRWRWNIEPFTIGSCKRSRLRRSERRERFLSILKWTLHRRNRHENR